MSNLRTVRLARAALRTLFTPLFIGSPGIGKSALARSLAQSLGVKSYVICLSHKEGTEVHGTPVLSQKRIKIDDEEFMVVEQAPPKYAVEAMKQEFGAILVYDELTCTPHTTMAPALSIMHEYVLGELQLPSDRIGIIACANPPSLAAGGWKLPPPMANRLKHLPFWSEVTSTTEWIENFPGYWGQPPQLKRWGQEIPQDDWARARTLVAAFIRRYPDHLLKVPVSAEDRSGAWPSPRTWDMVSRDIVAAELEGLNDDERHILISGSVGEGCALQLAGWLAAMDMPDPRELIDNPNKFVIPDNDDKLFYILMACCEDVTYRIKQSEAPKNAHNKKKKNEAYQAWLNVWKLVSTVVQGQVVDGVTKTGPKDIAAIAANHLANHQPKNAIAPNEANLFPAITVSAGVDWKGK